MFCCMENKEVIINQNIQGHIYLSIDLHFIKDLLQKTHHIKITTRHL